MNKLDLKRITKALDKFGLSDKEQAVYLESLKHKETSPFAIAKATNIPRTTVYDVLLNLSLKGLITLKQSDGLQKQQTKVRAKNPSVLRKILWQRKEEITSTDVDITEILPFLKGDYHGNDSNADFQFFPGIEGVKKAYFANAPLKSKRRVFENMMPMDIFGIEEMNTGTDDETNDNVQSSAEHLELIPLTDWTKHVLSYQQGRNPDYLKGRKIRYVDNPIFKNNIALTLQDDRLYVASSHEEETWGMIIHSPAFYTMLCSIFDMLWQSAQPITPELVSSWGENDFLVQENKR